VRELVDLRATIDAGIGTTNDGDKLAAHQALEELAERCDAAEDRVAALEAVTAIAQTHFEVR
jgi:hypothetical protein